MNWLDCIKDLKLPELKGGGHDSPKHGLCAMEMVAYIERLPHSDRPPCTSPVLGFFVRAINDRFEHVDRQKLLPILPTLVGTNASDYEYKRAKFIVMEMIKRALPIILEIVDLNDKAKKLKEFSGSLEELKMLLDELKLSGTNVKLITTQFLFGTNVIKSVNSSIYFLCEEDTNGAVAAISICAPYAQNETLEILKEAIAIGPSTGWSKSNYYEIAKELECTV